MTKMTILAIEEPDVITPPTKYSSFRTYDIEIWSGDDNEVCVTAYPVYLDIEDPEQIAGTDHDSKYYTKTYYLSDESVHNEIDWWLCSFLSLTDWTNLEGLTEWQTYWGNTPDFEGEAMGEKKPMPASIEKWLDELPEYEPDRREA